MTHRKLDSRALAELICARGFLAGPPDANPVADLMLALHHLKTMIALVEAHLDTAPRVDVDVEKIARLLASDVPRSQPERINELESACTTLLNKLRQS